MDIKVGEYIRTNEGEIFKVGRISDDYLAEIKEYGGTGCFTEDVTKHSFDIIDLIEVGDYINGERIESITNKTKLITGGGYDLLKKYKGIKTIVTKEQFKAMEYEV